MMVSEVVAFSCNRFSPLFLAFVNVFIYLFKEKILSCIPCLKASSVSQATRCFVSEKSPPRKFSISFVYQEPEEKQCESERVGCNLQEKSNVKENKNLMARAQRLRHVLLCLTHFPGV